MTRKSQLVARKLIKNLIFLLLSRAIQTEIYFPFTEFSNSNEFLYSRTALKIPNAIFC
jgi:DUF2075 family protein